MRYSLPLLLALLVCVPTRAQDLPPADQQIATAVLAAPDDRRDGAAVLGYDATGAIVTLREGTNDLVCLADDPSDERFQAACYQASLEPFMARGRALRAEGKSRDEVVEMRHAEAEAGTLAMPEAPAMLYVLSGEGYEVATGTVSEEHLRYVVYMPWATVEETGFPARPMTPGGPWLMDPGTPSAHVMITPPRQ